VVSFTLRPLYPQEKTHPYPWIRGWLGSGASLNAVAKRESLTRPYWESKPSRLALLTDGDSNHKALLPRELL
jgi:hypothetical protein